MKTATAINPLLDPGFVPGDRWAQANLVRAGASLSTCGKHPEYYDPRPYAMALMETSYPFLKQLFEGQWGKEAQQECVRFLADALGRGSSPMSLVAALFLQTHSEFRRNQVWSELDARQQAKLRLHLDLAKDDPENKRLFA